MRVLPVLLLACLLVPAPCSAMDFSQDESGSVKLTLNSLPFFGEPDEDADRAPRYDDYDPDDEEYTTDSLGRRVPARTRKGGSAIRGL